MMNRYLFVLFLFVYQLTFPKRQGQIGNSCSMHACLIMIIEYESHGSLVGFCLNDAVYGLLMFVLYHSFISVYDVCLCNMCNIFSVVLEYINLLSMHGIAFLPDI